MPGWVYLGGMKKYCGPTSSSLRQFASSHHPSSTLHSYHPHEWNTRPPPFYFKNPKALQPGEEDRPALGFGARAGSSDKTEAAFMFLTGFALFFVSTDLFACALHRTDGTWESQVSTTRRMVHFQMSFRYQVQI